MLSRYFDVMKDKLPSQFQISQSLNVDFKKDSPEKELFGIHDEAMKLFYEKLDGISSLKEISPRAESSLLDLKEAIADKILEACHFCERRCRINRKKKEIGYCRLDAVSRYTAEFLHHGEEPELVPSHTIFFAGCNFSCVYCQNWEISQAPESGNPILPEELARIITLRRAYGSRNVNVVTPTPHTHTILKILNALRVNVPVVWNSNMYYSYEIAKLLEGVVDVYLGDFRYGNDECARKYSNVPDYWQVITRNFKTAYMKGEILLRQLVLPGHVECCTKPIVKWTVENIPKIRFNLMFQYRPAYRAYEYPQINRSLTREECQKALDIVKESELEDVLV
ncbi:MAG: radical SAM protein [Euryarchaeota archaeon]|nr:radical SAM protein [Euryarchaeota archaeon]MBU4491505.1 radical SAM protein [Euryarchaeota archaeon]MCG2727453.1 radical SAM protein [Candidatus Methanoperedenaceae archaeon]